MTSAPEPHRPSSPPRPPARPGHHGSALPEPSTIPEQGWHCGHTMYRFRRELICGPLSRSCQDQFRAALHSESGEGPERLGAYWTSGHRADFVVMAMDPDPAKVDAVHQQIMAPPLGQFVEATWSFVSMSEISEYVPSLDQYRERLIASGAEPDSPALVAKMNAYERRLPMMMEQRLRPEIPDWPSACFYPMNKSRVVGANWFTEPFSKRNAMMAEHAQSGMAYAGKVSQLITVGVGLDDWEWMVTLWGRNPQYLKDIVYKMRFDEASAKYGEFGPFYVGYKATADEIIEHCRMK
ncbi:putative heme peroxidase [Planctomycetes bacterium CA13]|uniref:Putative heme peroxidase n=1 Tax=Novipirellula herctigrandis TaxID=2527986 RepID=A0A5C5Z9F8_9BACT|nr:putative heme peroxidase [Planctomycetes bacterium CA13]